MPRTLTETEEMYIILLEHGVLDVYSNNYVAMIGPHVLDADMSKETLESRVQGPCEIFYVDPPHPSSVDVYGPGVKRS